MHANYGVLADQLWFSRKPERLGEPTDHGPAGMPMQN